MSKCRCCNKEYHTDCDHKQGRCPGHKPMVDLDKISSDQKSRYLNTAKRACIIFAGIALILGLVPAAGVMLIVAEAVNVVKETYDLQ